MDTYDVIKNNKDYIELANLVWTISHPKDDYEQDIMTAVGTDKKLYLFYQYPYQSNADYLEYFNMHIKVN